MALNKESIEENQILDSYCTCKYVTRTLGAFSYCGLSMVFGLFTPSTLSKIPSNSTIGHNASDADEWAAVIDLL